MQLSNHARKGRERKKKKNLNNFELCFFKILIWITAKKKKNI